MNEFYIWNWLENDQNARQLFFSGDTLAAFRQWIDHLNGLFSYKIEFLKLDLILSPSDTDYILKLFEMNPPFLFFKCSDHDHLMRSVMNREKDFSVLSIDFKPKSPSVLDLNNVKVKDYFESFTSHWISFEQMMTFSCENISIFRTSFVPNNFKTMIREWRDGWNPIWKSACIDCSEFRNIINLIDDVPIDIDGFTPFLPIPEYFIFLGSVIFS
ncbi:hypothetical protein GCK72_018379 [Caenorhabditis remanei]|uniref:F-box associated domain-containing protein n=1 Tax=Caenorhabditis remanei TaxID=31234 RepID=A0A6A5GB08_CAERE|nr:hypothetical protein GCK72_018379 [Caenorhabditis remanei]KAF1751825.1 hypothetical protein GCK72_018379 [Caenorhabditis remanei]